MRSYELQTYKDGKWKMDSVYDDRQFAIEQGKRVEQSSRYSGVRVIEENYDDATNESTTRTLFRGGIAKGKKALNPVKGGTSRSAEPGGGTGREPVRKGGRNPAAKKTNLLVPVLILMVVVLGGVIALLGLHHLSSSG